MSTIGGPGGLGGPRGPGGAGGPDGPEGPDGPDDVDEVGDVGGADGLAEAAQAGAAKLDALAADIASGKLTAREAIDRMVAEAGGDLPAAEQAELRELLTDLVENDPHLAALARQI